MTRQTVARPMQHGKTWACYPVPYNGLIPGLLSCYSLRAKQAKAVLEKWREQAEKRQQQDYRNAMSGCSPTLASARIYPSLGSTQIVPNLKCAGNQAHELDEVSKGLLQKCCSSSASIYHLISDGALRNVRFHKGLMRVLQGYLWQDL